ncbi:hypothetical protein HanRHA438_Chr16g0744831 [Helianthus annuus]|nr:hypothetical protein HanHA300_Chr16g0597051 [Helianthus annuus]KAJ0441323.1 hypothetical protein HanIR_Chr16g0796451 [Helianthus annuus]KAJ0459312.1 hypothetical protein HanHA89_Chr16g0647541 [Helianthus annuus]KAJ0643816.1 hypothetical protein HanOQP8_Chr16g0604791 [Helianthus annuus]KAJ0834541.1 hypothetical protein HanRHA438_Chr16g0744831 [Helianthus annuus]
MWNGSPPPLKPTPIGYGGAWVGGLGWGHEFGLAIESPPCHLTSPTSPPHARLQTHANGATPQTHAPTQAPGVVAWAFSANPRPNPSPIPHGLNKKSSTLSRSTGLQGSYETKTTGRHFTITPWLFATVTASSTVAVSFERSPCFGSVIKTVSVPMQRSRVHEIARTVHLPIFVSSLCLVLISRSLLLMTCLFSLWHIFYYVFNRVFNNLLMIIVLEFVSIWRFVLCVQTYIATASHRSTPLFRKHINYISKRTNRLLHHTASLYELNSGHIGSSHGFF